MQYHSGSRGASKVEIKDDVQHIEEALRKVGGNKTSSSDRSMQSEDRKKLGQILGSNARPVNNEARGRFQQLEPALEQR